MAKHIFISDIHLGSPLQKNHDDLLDAIVEKCDNMFLIGDIIDVWEDDLEDIIKDRRNGMIISSINMVSKLIPVYIIRGNHDPTIKELKKIFPKCRIYDKLKMDINGDKYILIHGHQFDDLIIKYSFLAKLFFIIYWICDKFS
jgi:UDP-2,3-diacylglucosamine pyrophosphatase LpxH